MTKILIIDDGDPMRASKARMYGRLAKARGADVTHAKLDDITNLNGYDIVFTDLDGRSIEQNNKFMYFSENSNPCPRIEMFSGWFRGDLDDLPVAVPVRLWTVVKTHNDAYAYKVIGKLPINSPSRGRE